MTDENNDEEKPLNAVTTLPVGLDNAVQAIELPSILTVDQVASILQVHGRTVRRLVEQDEIDYVRIGTRGIRITSNAVKDFIARGGARPKGRPPKDISKNEKSAED